MAGAGPGPGLGRVRSARRRQPRDPRGPAGDCLLGALRTECKSGSSLVYKGVMDSSLKNTAISLSSCSLESEFTATGRENNIRSSDFLKHFKDWDCFDAEQDSFCDSNGLEIEEKSVICSETDAIQNTTIYMEPGHTLPSHLAANTQENSDQNIVSSLLKKIVRGTDAQACNSQGLIPPHISQIYDELFVIHQKLQRESSAQQEYALQLQKRERCLAEKEALLFKHEAALAKIRDVEKEVHTKFGAIKERHEAEVKQLTEALREITKENRRLKSSFDTLKEMNDSLRKQLSDITELNKKLEGQARKVQARLENLQRKHEFSVVRKSDDIRQVTQQSKPVKQEKVMVTSKAAKLPLNSQVYEFLTFLMDWISDEHLSKIKPQEEREDSHELTVTQSSNKPSTRQKCMKLLPIATEQLQWMPYVNSKLHIPIIKFIYWSIRHLDTDIQHATMRSTMRRLGEDIFKGIVSKGNPHGSSEQSVESKSKSAAFFKSSCMPLRFLSTLIVLKTVTQVDYLAQAFDSLRIDLKTDEGKALFLEYQCVPVVLSHLKVSSRGLLSCALDGLLQMTMESGKFGMCGTIDPESKFPLQVRTTLTVLVRHSLTENMMSNATAEVLVSSLPIYVQDLNEKFKLMFVLLCILLAHSPLCTPSPSLSGRFTLRIWESPDTTISMGNGGGLKGSLQPFLEACSNESFFRTCSILLRSSKLDVPVLEKLCVILQKLSRIKSNKKMFELFALHQMIQELHRTTNPDHTFLCINLNSILLNLGLLRGNSLASSLSTSQ